MRCLHVLATVDDPSAGPSYSVPGLAGGLCHLGHDVSIHTVAGWRSRAKAGGRATLDERFASLIIQRHPWTLSRVPVLRELAWSEDLRLQLVREGRSADIIHSHGLWLMPNVFPSWAVAAEGARAKLLLSPRGMLGEAALRFSSLKKRVFWTLLQRWALEKVDCFHATSDTEADEIRGYGLRQPIAVIPNGIDVAKPQSLFSGPSDARTVLSLGRIHPKKGLDRLLKAWGILEPRYPDWRLRIVGPDEGGTAAELFLLSRSLGLQRATIEGPVFGVEKNSILTDADLFVLPTLNENFAMTVAEALAAGVPVISSKGAPWPGIISNNCGWWIDHGVEPLAATLSSAMSMAPDALREMGENGRNWMARAFSWKAIARATADTYEWLGGRMERPSHVITD